MINGTPRREATQDSLAGQAGMTPVSLQGPGVRTAAAPTQPDVSLSGTIARNLADWGAGKLQVAADKNHKRSTFEGQMAYTQGQTFDQVEMGGDKWALEGYRVMDAQAVASTLMGAQRADIDAKGYELGAEEFRAQYTNRVEGIVKDLDPRTADLVREQMAAQMPTLVEDQTVKHLTWKEGKNYESLSRSVDVISRDPTATGELVAYAKGGEGSASAGLSEDRRKGAVVDGVITAFSNDNPLAYAALSREGLLGENLTVDQQERIRSAKAGFENRMRSEYDEEMFTSLQELSTSVEMGTLSPTAAVEELSGIYADRGITMDASDAGTIYGAAQNSERVVNQTKATLVEEAAVRGDYDTIARITEPLLVQRESGGDPDAVSSAGAKGTHQVMDDTNLDPGFGVRPAADDSKAERARVGSDYWRAMVKRYRGDVEAAAVAYNAGPGNADKWVAGGRDYSVLPHPEETEPYAKGMLGDLGNWKAPTPQDKLATAQALLGQTRDRVALDTYEAVTTKNSDLDNQFIRGDIDKQSWLEGRKTNAAEYGQARTAADVNHEVSTSTSVENALIKKRDELAKKTGDDAAANDKVVRLDQATADILGAREKYTAVVNDPASSREQVMAATAEFSSARNTALDKYKIDMTDRGNGAAMKDMVGNLDKWTTAHTKWTQEETEIGAAISGGTVKDLPPAMQRRAFDSQQGAIQKKYSDAVAARQMTAEQAGAALTAEYTNLYAKAGMVDPRVSAQMSAAMLAPMIDKEGNPNPAAVSTVTQYARLKAQNPRAAATMLDDDARVLAEAVLSRAADPSLYGEAVRNLGVELTVNRRVEDSLVYMQRDDVQSEIDRQATLYLEERDIGKLQAIWQNDADMSQVYDSNYSGDQRIRSPETRELVKTELSVEIARLQRINPKIKPRDLATMAADNMTRRTEVIGGDVVVLSPGSDIMATMFGGRASEVDHDGVVNTAITNWLRDPATQETYGFLGGPSFSETLPGFVQGGFDAAAQVFGGSFQPGMSTRDSISFAATGLRPMRSYTTADGKGIVLEVLKADGNYSEPIVVPMKEVGNLYMKTLKQTTLN